LCRRTTIQFWRCRGADVATIHSAYFARLHARRYHTDKGRTSSAGKRGLARDHEGKAGVYAAVVVEGTIRPHDKITLQE
jgi:hypothetical protein